MDESGRSIDCRAGGDGVGAGTAQPVGGAGTDGAMPAEHVADRAALGRNLEQANPMKQVNPRLTSREEPGGPDASGEAMQRATSCPGRMAG